MNERLRPVKRAIRRLPRIRRPIEAWNTSTVTGRCTLRVKRNRTLRPFGTAAARTNPAFAAHAVVDELAQPGRASTSPPAACARHSSVPPKASHDPPAASAMTTAASAPRNFTAASRSGRARGPSPARTVSRTR